MAMAASKAAALNSKRRLVVVLAVVVRRSALGLAILWLCKPRALRAWDSLSFSHYLSLCVLN